jgi:hypothetical protein
LLSHYAAGNAGKGQTVSEPGTGGHVSRPTREPDIETECSYYGSHRDQQLLQSGYGHAASRACPAGHRTVPGRLGSMVARRTATVAGGKLGAAGKTGIRDASTRTESTGSEEYAARTATRRMGIYPGQSGLAVRGPLAWARIARGFMNSGRNHEEQRGGRRGRAGDGPRGVDTSLVRR